MSASSRLLSAAVFLGMASIKNGIRSRFRRLRQPRYLFATAIGMFYVWTILIRRATMSPWVTPERIPVAEAVLLAMALSGVISAWVLGGDEGAIQFSEPEVQFLFPGPLDRALLLHYKLIRIIVVTAWSAIITTILMGLRLTSHWFVFWVGAWIALSTLGLHLTAASLTRAMLVDRGLAGVRRRLLTVLAAAVVIALLIAGAATAEPLPLATPSMAAFLGWAGRAVTEGPAGIALLPARASLDVALAQTPLAMARALPFALLSLAAHYLWAARSAYAFEDASVHAAERRARSLDALRSGQSRWIARTPAPFTLGGTGRPEVALLWRSGIAALRVLSLRFVILVSVVIAVSMFAAMSAFSEGDGGMAAAIAFTAIAAACVAALLGPQSLQLDLRMDRDRMDVLRSWPLPGWRIVAGSIAGPAILLGGSVVAMVWFAWVTAVFGGLVHGTWPLAAVITAAMVGPAIATCGLVVNTGWAVAFPTWSATDSRAGGGFEAFGQRLLLMLSSVAVVGIALVPAMLVGAPIWLLGSGVAFALPLAAAVGTVILLVEAFLGILLIGRLFDRFEPVIA